MLPHPGVRTRKPSAGPPKKKRKAMCFSLPQSHREAGWDGPQAPTAPVVDSVGSSCNGPFNNQVGDRYGPAPNVSPPALYQDGPASLRLSPSSPFLPEPALPITQPVLDPGPMQTPAWPQPVAWLPGFHGWRVRSWPSSHPAGQASS